MLLLGAGCDEETASAADPAPRSSEFRSREVDGTLERISEVIQVRGFLPDGEPERGFLVERASRVRELALAADSCYVAVAAGTRLLLDLDLRLHAADGSEVAANATTSSSPALLYCPPHPGTHYLSIEARAGTGLFGLQVFRGPRGLDIRLDDIGGASPSRGDDLQEAP